MSVSSFTRSILILLITCVGCGSSSQTHSHDSLGVLILVPGVNGDGPWYAQLKQGLRDGGVTARIDAFSWGAPGPLFAMNFNSKGIHEGAEKGLAAKLKKLLDDPKNAPIIIIGHSAGAGVTVGALARLPAGKTVDRVVLLHPSLSPKFDLTPALARIRTSLTVFHSERDTGFLKWRTGSFGTYDGVKTTAAGNCGFDLSSLSSELRAKVKQIPYEQRFEQLDNDGGHFSPTSRRFIEQVVAPLVK